MNSFDSCSDEELVLLMRVGLENARETLAGRYYKNRFLHCRRAMPGNGNLSYSMEFSQTFFATYLACENNYRLGTAKFRKYFETALRHDMCVANGFSQVGGKTVYSLDEAISDDENSELSFSDCMPCSQYEDPRIFLNFAEEAFALKETPAFIDKKALAVASLRIDGCTYQEIADLLKISLKQAKTRYAKFRDFIVEAVKKGMLPGNPGKLN